MIYGILSILLSLHDDCRNTYVHTHSRAAHFLLFWGLGFVCLCLRGERRASSFESTTSSLQKGER